MSEKAYKIRRPKLLFGDLAVQGGVITQDQLRDALVVQEATPGKNLGEVLVGMGVLTETQVAMVAEWQEKLRNGGLDVRECLDQACSEDTANTSIEAIRALVEPKKVSER